MNIKRYVERYSTTVQNVSNRSEF